MVVVAVVVVVVDFVVVVVVVVGVSLEPDHSLLKRNLRRIILKVMSP